MSIAIIALWPQVHECVVCGDECDGRQGLPMYEDLVLPNDWKGDWGGFHACKRCFLLNDNPPEPRRPIRPDSITNEGRPT